MVIPTHVTLQFATQVKRIALRILYTHACLSFNFLIMRLAKEEGNLPLFLFCFDYLVPSGITRAVCGRGMKH
jgi:hypothetical protein